jgi:plastocyanin
MSRGTAPRLTLITLATAAALYVAVPLAGPVSAAAEHRIRVTDSAFDPVPIDVDKGDTVVWELQPSAQLTHTVTSEDGLFRAELVPGSANTEFRYTFNTANKYTYFCENHLQSNFMAGQVRVAETAPPPTTTTTTEPPTTTTTTAPPPTTTTTAPPPPPPTTTTTRPRATTTTTRPPATSPTTEAPAQASTDKPDTTSTTARGTTTSGKPTTTTAGKKKPSTTTTQAPETTTSSVPALPADWIPTPDIVPDDAATTTTTSPDTEAAASSKPKGGKGGGGGGFPLAGAGILGLLVVGGAGWGWYHRSSRYLPA